MFDNDTRDTKIKALRDNIDSLERNINRWSSNQDSKYYEILKLLEDFGIFRACSNCKHGKKCCAIKDKLEKHIPDTHRHDQLNSRTLCNDQYWERGEENGNQKGN
jgi:hypothetical protein